MKSVSILFCLLVLLTPAAIWAAAKPIPNPPELDATSYFLIDFDSGRVLAEKNPDDPVEPASITKLMTTYLVDKAIAAASEAGKIDESKIILTGFHQGAGLAASHLVVFRIERPYVPTRRRLSSRTRFHR